MLYANSSCSYHYNNVTMGAIASQITSLTIVYRTVDSDADQREHQSFASLAFVWGIHRGPVNSPHKKPVTWKMFPFSDLIMRVRKVVWKCCVCKYIVHSGKYEQSSCFVVRFLLSLDLTSSICLFSDICLK